jgi:antitoxin (DNA-binding transcriptional repressor) of toxin-antitoxin stability system
VKRYTISQARERLAEVLDHAERGTRVVIERRNVEYEVKTRPLTRRKRSARSLIESRDAAVAQGQWRWVWTPEGLRFDGRRRRS